MNDISNKKQFIERVGIVFEQTGLPRMAGRIFGLLLISPQQSSDDIVKTLNASRGSVSTMTRMLIRQQFIERVGIPGDRRDYFQLDATAWRNLIRHGIEDEIRMFRELAAQGLSLFPEDSPDLPPMLKDIEKAYSLLDDQLPSLIKQCSHEVGANKNTNLGK